MNQSLTALKLFFWVGCLSSTFTPCAAEDRTRSGDPSQTAEAEYQIDREVLYAAAEGPSQDGLTPYQKERCRLDVYHPANTPDFATVVWFHGGGLKGGNRSIPEPLKRKGIAVVAVNYRLHPRVNAPVYVEDAAAAVAWTFKNIASYGGSPQKIFVAGHSAGGYLTSMVGLDKRWLARHDIDANHLAGLIPVSGQAVTHSTVRAERGIPETRPIIDELAPLYHVRGDSAPVLLITGDRDKEIAGRYEENLLLWRMMQATKHPRVELFELEGFAHSPVVKPAHELILQFIEQTLKSAR